MKIHKIPCDSEFRTKLRVAFNSIHRSTQTCIEHSLSVFATVSYDDDDYYYYDYYDYYDDDDDDDDDYYYYYGKLYW